MQLQKTIFRIGALALTLLLVACGADKNLKRGEKYLALGEYYDASSEFKAAYSKTSAKYKEKRGQIAGKMAFCYERINSTQKAIAAYRNVIRYKQDDAQTHLGFARQLLRNGNYKEAATEFELVLDSLPGNKMAMEGLQSARMAPQWKEQGSRYTVKKMDIFNSRRADYCPMLLGEQYEFLYFTSTRNEATGDELSGITGAKPGDIFFSQKDDKGKWLKPEKVEGGLNTEYDEGACSFSTDQREMFFTQCSSDPSYPRYAKILRSNRSDASWGKGSEAVLSKDTLSSYAHPAISPDGRWLYFCSDMPGGQGGLDIWRAEILSGNNFGSIENLGPTINTEGDEMFPTFRPNGDLYFSSDGHAGLGGLDIFIAKIGNDKRWHLEHPGYPLNSQGDDFGMTFEGPYNRGYFCSSRGDGRGWDHIFSFEKPEIVQTIKGWVYEMDGYELPAAQVFMVGNDGTNLRLSVKSDGSFEQVINDGVEYVLLATCKGYLNHKEELKAESHLTDSKEHVLQFPLASIVAPVMIDNIFYDYDKATLRPESTAALDDLVKLLNENPNVTIELSAHCDYRGSLEYNRRLALRRAQSVVDYLIAHGIASDRLTPMGYGKEKPKTIRKNQAQKYPWLKEGDVLTQEFIDKLGDNEKQEICNQLNRRTEFIVLRTTYGLLDEEGNLKNPPKSKPKMEDADDEEDGFDVDF